jgi:UDP-N-acetylenolpyruvoylglucosamine reductase
MGSEGNQLHIKKRIEKINDDRNLTQPKGIKTGGSTFKNPDRQHFPS